MNKKILAIINPASAGGKTAKKWPQKSSYFQKEFKNLNEIYTKKSGDALKYAKKAVENDCPYIMAVGGDGTVNEIANGMLRAAKKKLKSKLIVYAQGTGSDLSRSLKLPVEIEDFADLIKVGKSRKISVIRAEFCNYQGEKESRYFLNIADCGMGAVVAKKINQSKKTVDGSLSYLFKIFQTLFTYQNQELIIKADQKLIYQGKLNSAVIANGNYFGGGIKIAPAASLFNKKLNLVLLKDLSKLSLVLNLVKAYKGKHLKHPLVEQYFAKEVMISSQKTLDLELDGESVGTTDLKFEVSKKQISVLC